MPRSKWISFGGQQSLERPNKQDATAATTASPPPPSPADAKKFGLENVSISAHLQIYSIGLNLTMSLCCTVRQHLVSDLAESPHDDVFDTFSNSYANSVLQALYFCSPFRDLLLKDVENFLPSKVPSIVTPIHDKPIPLGRRKSERKASIHTVNVEHSAASQSGGVAIPSSSLTLHSALQSLFLHIATSPMDKGTVAPRAFIDKLKELNELFRSTMHQDAHEFLNYLLNQIVEEIEEERKNASNAEDCELSKLFSCNHFFL